MRTIDALKLETGVPVVVADDQGFITYVNGDFQKAFGWTPEEIVGRLLTTIIPKPLHDAHHMGFSRFITTGKPTLLGQPLTLKAMAKDGRIFEAEHVISAERLGDRWAFGATIRPL